MKRKVAYLRQFWGARGEDQFCRRYSSVNFGNETMEESLSPQEKIPHMMIKFLFLHIYLKNIAIGSVLYYKLTQK
jgi:hypothetical protein